MCNRHGKSNANGVSKMPHQLTDVETKLKIIKDIEGGRSDTYMHKKKCIPLSTLMIIAKHVVCDVQKSLE